jgi:hypothetical protein
MKGRPRNSKHDHAVFVGDPREGRDGFSSRTMKSLGNFLWCKTRRMKVPTPVPLAAPEFGFNWVEW